MPPRRRAEAREEEDGEEFFQAQGDALVPPQPQINFRNLDSYKFDVLAKFDRGPFLSFSRKHRHTLARCARDNVAPTPIQELFAPAIIGRVMKAAGLAREERDEFGEAWIALSSIEILSALNAHFLGSATQQEQQQLYEAIPLQHYNGFPSLQVSYETYCADWTRLSTDLARASDALDDGAPPLAASTRLRVLQSKLAECSVFAVLFKGKKFEDEENLLDLIDPFLEGIVSFQRQHHGTPGISWPALTCSKAPKVLPKDSGGAAVNSLEPEETSAADAPAPKSKNVEDRLISAINALEAASSKFGAKPSAAAPPLCTHCGGRHDVKDCWYRHIKKPKGGGVAIISSEERSKVRVSRGLTAVAKPRRANSPHPRPRAATPSDDDVNDDAYPSPCTPLAARAAVGTTHRALRRQRARDARTASIQAFDAELIAAGVLPQPLPSPPPPSAASLRRHARQARRASRSPEEV